MRNKCLKPLEEKMLTIPVSISTRQRSGRHGIDWIKFVTFPNFDSPSVDVGDVRRTVGPDDLLVDSVDPPRLQLIVTLSVDGLVEVLVLGRREVHENVPLVPSVDWVSFEYVYSHTNG